MDDLKMVDGLLNTNKQTLGVLESNLLRQNIITNDNQSNNPTYLKEK